MTAFGAPTAGIECWSGQCPLQQKESDGDRGRQESRHGGDGKSHKLSPKQTAKHLLLQTQKLDSTAVAGLLIYFLARTCRSWLYALGWPWIRNIRTIPSTNVEQEEGSAKPVHANPKYQQRNDERTLTHAGPAARPT